MTSADIETYLLHQPGSRILLIPFEDPSLEQIIPSVQHMVHVLKKHDLTGQSFGTMVRRLREVRVETAVLSLYRSAVNRSETSAHALLLATRARYRFLRRADGSFRPVSRTGAAATLMPQVVVGGILGMLAVIVSFLGTFLPMMRRAGKSTSANAKTIVFIRADLPGALRAGGSVSHVRGMINAFRRSGFRVVYMSDAEIPGMEKEVEQILVRPLPILDVLDEFQLCAYNLQMQWMLRRVIHETNPAFVYQRHAVFHWMSAWVARSMGVPFVLEANASEVWAKQRWSRLIFSRTAKACEQAAITLSDKVAVISKGVEEQLLPAGLNAAQVVLNPNGVDPEEFHPQVDGSEVRKKYTLEGTTVVGFIGTFTRWHGVETLFEAAVAALKQNDSLRFLLIGDGELRAHLERQAQDLGIADRIVFTGLIPHADAPKHLAACDILVSPHLGFEKGEKFFGSPTKLFEYMAMGKAIIASDLEQIGEVIQDGSNGRKMEPGNVAQLTSLILELSLDTDQRLRLGKAAADNVTAQYTWEQNVTRILTKLQSTPKG
jgi:glycosyltransferase involved in cell wall biosynthesis